MKTLEHPVIWLAECHKKRQNHWSFHKKGTVGMLVSQVEIGV